VCTAFLISSLNDLDTGLPAHSDMEASEKSGCSIAFELVAVRYGCIGSRRSKHLPHTFCGLRSSVSPAPHTGCAETRSSGAVPEPGCSSALELQQRWQKSCPHCRQWCLRVKAVNSSPHRMQLLEASSGSHSAVPRALLGRAGPRCT
jgi:hypothetical protein